MASEPSNQSRAADQAAKIQQLIAAMEAQQATIARLETRLATADTINRRERTTTPTESAFGGTEFRPTGIAALPAFTPFNGNGKGPNPEYSDKSRARAENPGKFSGDEKEFDNWVQKLADKFEEDVSTFRNEKSRMIYMMTQLEGDAQKAVEVRYRSTEDPFSCVAEMVQVLEAPYHYPNQASTARQKLRQHKFRPGKMNVR